MQPDATIDTPYGKARVVLTKYRDGNPAVLLENADNGEPIATLSVNVPDRAGMLGDQEFFAKTWSENEQIAEAALESGLFKDTGRFTLVGFVTAEIWTMSA